MAAALNHEDIRLLIEGLESIEKSAAMSDSMEGLVTGILLGIGPKDDVVANKMEAERAQRKAKAAAANLRKKEDVYLLRAKLVEIRRALDGEVADKLLEDSRA